ncbi:Tannase and feruloyl esterase [compost metagenome]
MQDINNTDLTAFHKRGGKVLMAHGAADALVSTRATEQYFDRVINKMGRQVVRQFVRFYEVPGYGHAVSTTFNANWDSLAALDQWSTTNKAPESQIVTDATGVPGRTRPLCEYPFWPRYKGTGDVNKAESFMCWME